MLDTCSLCREGMLVPLPGLGWGEVAEDFVLAQTAAVVEGLDEGEDLGAGGGPVGPDANADLLFEQGPETLRGGVVAARPVASTALSQSQLTYLTSEFVGQDAQCGVGEACRSETFHQRPFLHATLLDTSKREE